MSRRIRYTEEFKREAAAPISGEMGELVHCKWCPEVDLNHRHTDFQSVALPTELSGPNRCAKHLSERRVIGNRVVSVNGKFYEIAT